MQLRTSFLIGFFITAALITSACGSKSSTGPAESTATQCRGIYYTTDSNGDLHKWNEFHTVNDSTCLTDNMALSRWQVTSAKFTKQQVRCTPQTTFASTTLTSSNNYYSYRDGRILLDLDSSTGIYRRLVLGQAADGSDSFSRSEGCFYERAGTGVDAAYGTQLLLDSDVSRWASADEAQPMEIFRLDTVNSIVTMTRFDSIADWTYKFCPYLSVPSQYCAGLDDGNIMFYPTLTATQQAALKAEAILISTQFNYVVTSREDFNSFWNQIDASRTETPSAAFKYMVIGNADVPYYIDQAWHDFVTGARAHMPDTASNRLPNICYPGSEHVTLADGSAGRIYGEVCYSQGVYSFTRD
jgi:hypothetical protein